MDVIFKSNALAIFVSHGYDFFSRDNSVDDARM